MRFNTVKILSLTLLLAVLHACSSNSTPSFQPLMERQPFVKNYEPDFQQTLINPVEFTLFFSERIRFDSIQTKSIVLVDGPVEENLLADAQDFNKALTQGKLNTIPLIYELDENETKLNLFPQEPLNNGVYHLVVTPLLTSVFQIPFNQKPGHSPQAFVRTFELLDPSFSESSEHETSGNGDGSEPEPSDTHPSYGPAPEHLIINEVLYDGLHSDTNGECFIELHGTAGSDLSDYRLVLINGSDGRETNRIVLPTGSLMPEDEIFVIADLNTGSESESHVENFDFLAQFDPQNGPDAIQLLNREGLLIDALWYGTGAVETNADGLLLGEGLPAEDVRGGQSLSRTMGFDSQNNDLDFTLQEEPTPGVL